MALSLHHRLILCFAGVMTVCCGLIYGFMHHFISLRIDTELDRRLNSASAAVKHLHEKHASRRMMHLQSLAMQPQFLALAEQMEDREALTRLTAGLRAAQNFQLLGVLDLKGSLRALDTISAGPDAFARPNALLLNPAMSSLRLMHIDGRPLEIMVTPLRTESGVRGYLLAAIPVNNLLLETYAVDPQVSLTLLDTNHSALNQPADPGAVVVHAGNGFWFRLALDRNLVASPFNAILKNIAVIGLASIALTILGSFWIAGLVSRPVQTLARITDRIRQGDIHLRAESEGPVEIRKLSEALNAMMDAIASGQERLQARVHQIEHQLQEMQQLQGQLAQAQKMEAVGRLAGGLAHDFNNLLTIILGNCELAMHNLGPEDNARTDLSHIMDAAERAAELTSRLLVFDPSKASVGHQFLQLNDTVLALRPELSRLLGSQIWLETTLDPELPLIEADPGRIEQVITNIAQNAADAMDDEGGTLTIETRADVVDPATEGNHDNVPPGHYVVLCLRDTGCGMDEETLAHVFEPLFSTRQKSRGKGLGLATVYGIVSGLRGEIRVSSTPGEGTAITLYFHVADGDGVPHAQPGGSVHATPSGSETILLVDDDSEMLSLIERTLATYGYTVRTAHSAREALDIAESRPDAADLVLTDVMMPEMNGPELVEALRHKRPGQKYLFMSGYEALTLMQLDAPVSDKDLIRKPFTSHELLKRVRSVLDQTA